LIKAPVLKRIPWLFVLIFTLLAAGLLSLSYVFTMQLKNLARASQESELSTIAEMKALQVSSWRQERLSLTGTIFAGTYFPSKIEALLRDPGSAALKRDIQGGLDHMRKSYSLEISRGAVALANQKILMLYPADASFTPSAEAIRVRDIAWRTEQVVVGDLRREGVSGKILLPIAIPIFSSRTGGDKPGPIAVMILDLDPGQTLYPLLQNLPSARATSEILLIQREGQDFLYLSEPRLWKNVALNLKLPIARFRRSGDKTTIGEEGVIEGTDYRGHEILGFIKSVPDSPWLVEVKIDADEIQAGWGRGVRILAAIIIAFVLAAGITLHMLWKSRMARINAEEGRKWDRAFKNQDDFLRVMIDVMPNAAYLKDPAGRIRGCNAAFEKLLNLSKDKIVGKAFGDVTSGELVEKDAETDRLLLEKPGVQVYESLLKAWDGVEHHIIFIKSTYAQPDGETGGLVGTMIDITQRRRAEDELQQIKKFSDGIIQTMTEGLVLTDSEGRFTFANPAAAGLLGYMPGEMVEREVVSFIPKDQQPILRRADERRAKGIADRYELEFLHKDGSRKIVLVSGGPRFTGVQYGGTMAVLTDITERKLMEEEIRALSLTDALTGLYNRRGFMHVAEQQLKVAGRMNKRVFLLFSDVDRLKHINDTFGHMEGDRVLIDLANILKLSFRDSDIVARMGGDEFIVMAMEAAKVSAEVFTRRLQEKLDHYNSRSDIQGRYTLTLSTGLSIYDPELPMSIEDLVRRADSLMYEEKRRKK